MKLDRNITNPKRGKYALIKMREVPMLAETARPMPDFGRLAIPKSAIDFGDSEATDFFVIRLRDKYASAALHAYASKAREDGEFEYAHEITVLANMAENHPDKRKPS